MNTIDPRAPRPTPETDAVIGFGPTHYEWREHARRLERERNEAREQFELWQMRLAACDVVAMSDTESSRGPARDMHKDYWSAAVESVIRRLDECIELRKQLEAMREAIKEARIEINCALRISRLALRVCPYESGVDLVLSRIKAALTKLQPFIKP